MTSFEAFTYKFQFPHFRNPQKWTLNKKILEAPCVIRTRDLVITSHSLYRAEPTRQIGNTATYLNTILTDKLYGRFPSSEASRRVLAGFFFFFAGFRSL